MELRQRHRLNQRGGFSLVEVLLIVGVLGVVIAISTTGYSTTRRRATMTNQAQLAETAIRQAQSRSQTARDGQAWTIRCEGNHFETFYLVGSTRTNIQRADLTNGISCQTGTEVKFEKLTGVPSANVTFVMLSRGQAYKHIRIDQPGVITISSL